LVFILKNFYVVACLIVNAFFWIIVVTSGPVSTWMGDRLRAGKPSRYVTRLLSRLSLLSSVGR